MRNADECITNLACRMYDVIQITESESLKELCTGWRQELFAIREMLLCQMKVSKSFNAFKGQDYQKEE